MSLEAKVAELKATSYPYRWIRVQLGIPYWVVLAYWDTGATGHAAREYVRTHPHLDVQGLSYYLTIAEARIK